VLAAGTLLVEPVTTTLQPSKDKVIVCAGALTFADPTTGTSNGLAAAGPCSHKPSASTVADATTFAVLTCPDFATERKSLTRTAAFVVNTPVVADLRAVSNPC